MYNIVYNKSFIIYRFVVIHFEMAKECDVFPLKNVSLNKIELERMQHFDVFMPSVESMLFNENCSSKILL